MIPPSTTIAHGCEILNCGLIPGSNRHIRMTHFVPLCNTQSKQSGICLSSVHLSFDVKDNGEMNGKPQYLWPSIRPNIQLCFDLSFGFIEKKCQPNTLVWTSFYCLVTVHIHWILLHNAAITILLIKCRTHCITTRYLHHCTHISVVTTVLFSFFAITLS